jgi:hypothetical protein
MGLIDYISEFIAHVFFFSLTLLSAGGAGYFLLRKQRFHSVLERIIFSLALGYALWALLFFALGLLGFLYADWIRSVTFAFSFAVLFFAVRSRNLWRQFFQWCKSFKPALRHIIYVLSIFYIGILFGVTFYPPVVWDSTMYHLVLARQYLVEHQITVNTGLTFPILPALNHMLFVWALALKGHLLAQMIECTFLILTSLGLYSWGKRANQKAFGFALAAFWLSHPIVLLLGRCAFVDVCLAAFVFLGIYALRIFWDSHESSWWYVGIFLLSAASAVKIPGLIFLALGSLIGLFVCFKKKIPLKKLACGYGVAAIFLIPWYANIAYHTGNPVWPVLFQYSRGVWASPSIANTFEWIFKVGIPKTPLNFLIVTYQMAFDRITFQYPEYQGLFFPIIAWPVSLIVALFSRSVRWWVFWTFTFTLIWFLSSQQVRFWMVIVPVATIALFESLKWFVDKFATSQTLRNVIWFGLACIPLLFSIYKTGFLIRQFGYPSLTLQRQELFLKGGFYCYKAVEYTNKNSGKNDVVYVINASWLNYYFHAKVVDMNSVLQGNIRPVYRWPEDQQWLEYLKSLNVNWIFMNHKYTRRSGFKLEENFSGWQGYQLVYSDDDIWIFRKMELGKKNVL